jgi:hypothetical protein
MTNQYEVTKRIKEMLPDVTTSILKQAERLLNSGAVSLEDYEDDYQLPKIILTACLSEIADSYKPHDKTDIKTVNNLRYF